MSIINLDLLQYRLGMNLLHYLKKKIPEIAIKKIMFPSDSSQDSKASKFQNNFLAVELTDLSIGLVFINLEKEIRGKLLSLENSFLSQAGIEELLNGWNSNDLLDRTLAVCVLNALSQSYFSYLDIPLSKAENSIGGLVLNEDDHIGMVGYFTPLVKFLQDKSMKFTVIEKKEEFIQQHDNWEVSLNPKKLASCNKILITSTTMINHSLDSLLEYCHAATDIVLIGPSAGCHPQALFTRGITAIGGTQVLDPALFEDLFFQNQRWGPSTHKYLISKKEWKPEWNLDLNI